MTPKALSQLAISAAVVGAVAVGVFLYQRGGKIPGPEETARPTEAPAAATSARTDTTGQTAAESPPPAAAGEQPAKAPAEAAASKTSQQPQGVAEMAPPQAEAAAPTFDLVRVEPSGETVVAGRSEAGAIVALLSNGKVVGKGVANENGEFAIVLDEPLPPGAHDVTIEASDSAGEQKMTSEESVAVSVPETEDGEVLVLLSKPGAASEVLQQPETAEAEVEAGPETSETVAEAPPTPAAEPAPIAVAETKAAAETPDEMDKPAGGETAAVEETIAASSNETPAPETPAPETPAPETAAAPAEPEAEVAAAAETGDALPETQATAPAGETSQTKPDGETVVAVDEPAADAESKAPAPETASTEPAGDEAPARVTVDAVESENDKLFVAGAGEPNSDVRVYVDNQLLGSAKTSPDGRWLLEADKKIEAGEVEVRADQIGDEQGKVVARSEVTFEHAENEIVLRPVAVSGEGSGNLGVGAAVEGRPIANIIIRRGDNLWRISRRLYGKGIRYTTIYRANDSQIRDPDLIYPGQVFMLPERDVGWTEPAN